VMRSQEASSASRGTPILGVVRSQEASSASRGTPILGVVRSQEASSATSHGRDARATRAHGRDARATSLLASQHHAGLQKGRGTELFDKAFSAQGTASFADLAAMGNH
jgi:hypothetical protein